MRMIVQCELDYDPAMQIVNLEQLSRGTGCRFLEVLHGEGGTLVAKQWRRKPGNTPGVFIRFGTKQENGPCET